MRSVHRVPGERTLVPYVSVVVGLCFAALATGILPLTARADGSPSAGSPTCFAPIAGTTQVAFPVGATPPALPYPQVHQLTNEYSDRGFVFSDDDSDMAVRYK